MPTPPRINTSHPLLKGCRLFVVFDNPHVAQNLMGFGGNATINNPGVMARCGHMPALTFNGSSTYAQFGNLDAPGGLGFSSGDITVVSRHRYSAVQISAIADARDGGNNSGFYYGPSNFGGIENGTVLAGFGGGGFGEGGDQIGAATLAGQDVVAAGAYSRGPLVGNTPRTYYFVTRYGTRGPQLYAQANSGTVAVVPTTNPLYVGRNATGNYFNGLLSWLMIFDAALSPGHMARLTRDEAWPFLIDDESVLVFSPPPPPPPPADAASASGPLGAVMPGGRVFMPRPLAALAWPTLATDPPGQRTQSSENLQARPPQHLFPPILYPGRFGGMVPVRLEYTPDHHVEPPPPPTTGGAPPSIMTITPGPWNLFGRLSPASGLTRPVPTSPFSPPTSPPGTPPPPPPPPQGGTFGPSRNLTPSIPRAENVSDSRVRPHLDKVASLLNSLLRHGYIRQRPDGEFEVAGGAVALPRAPLATDDVTTGAVVGGHFINTLTNAVYICVNNSPGSAVWKLIG